MSVRKTILTRTQAEQKLHRMALELAENLSGDTSPLVIIGIRRNGEAIAAQLARFFTLYDSRPVQLWWIQMDKSHPDTIELSGSADLTGSHILLVDDVTNSGKTLLYALKPLLGQHPLSIQTLVLVERMHKQFPIKADYVGLSVATTLQEHIQVEVETGEVAGAYLQ
jgi:pyrimidine operon attenuation protein/uracil phosphoribosyltransferase